MQDIESFAVNRTLEEMKEFANQKEQSLYDKIVELNVRNTIALYSGCKKSEYNIHFLEWKKKHFQRVVLEKIAI